MVAFVNPHISQSQKFEGKSKSDRLCLQFNFSGFEKTITLPHFTLANIIYHLKVPLELCNVCVPNFSILQTLSSFGNLKR